MHRRHGSDIDRAWLATADDCIRRWPHLDGEERARLLEQAKLLDQTRSWEGLDGLAVTPEMRAIVATHACLLTVNVGMGVFADVTSILIAPTSAVRTARHQVDRSIVTESEACVLGESLMHGPVRLAWDQVLEEQSSRRDQSVVIHEFAHKIDMADGIAGGTPPIADRRQVQEFERAADGTLEALRAGTAGRSLRAYAAVNRAELFAVATEAFFLRPARLRSEHPRLYQALAGFYRQKPEATEPEAGGPD
jgi:Mlc titration factor MtfA (ptsG expression regulator)